LIIGDIDTLDCGCDIEVLRILNLEIPRVLDLEIPGGFNAGAEDDGSEKKHGSERFEGG
jgi:hypothetical protein